MEKEVNRVEVQRIFRGPGVPAASRIRSWAHAVLDARVSGTETVIRVVDVEESAELNRRYRNKIGPTNVLSFHYASVAGEALEHLGDIVICAPVVAREAEMQSKDPNAHWAHMVVHGLLHLLGYDHVDDPDAIEMETLETHILAGLGYPNPYLELADP